MISHILKKDEQVVCNIYESEGAYSKPFLYITDNASNTDYFKGVSAEFESKLTKIGLETPMCEFTKNSRIYRLPDIGWWNCKEKRWYTEEEYVPILNQIFEEITSN